MVFLKNVKILLYKLLEFCLKGTNFSLDEKVSKKTISKFFYLIHQGFKPVKLIRVGGNKDGGYLIPDDFSEIDFCFSPGVSDTIHFEEDIIKRGVHCYLADNSIVNPPIDSNKVKFIKKHIGVLDDESYMTMNTWMNMYSSQLTGKGILQMDIESNEYSAILSMSVHNLLKFKYLIIEFHNLHHLKNPTGFNIIYSTFTKILEHFNIVHIHPNNYRSPVDVYEYKIPPFMEFTFMNKGCNSFEESFFSFPHHLDCKNIPRLDDVMLPDCWFRVQD